MPCDAPRIINVLLALPSAAPNLWPRRSTGSSWDFRNQPVGTRTHRMIHPVCVFMYACMHAWGGYACVYRWTLCGTCWSILAFRMNSLPCLYWRGGYTKQHCVWVRSLMSCERAIARVQPVFRGSEATESFAWQVFQYGNGPLAQESWMAFRPWIINLGSRRWVCGRWALMAGNYITVSTEGRLELKSSYRPFCSRLSCPLIPEMHHV